MRILTIGTGKVGAALATRLRDLGHDLTLHNRTGTPPPGFAAADLTDDLPAAVAQAELILLAVPFAVAEELLQAGAEWNGKIVVDATNPIAPGLRHLTIGNTGSGAERLQELAPGASVVKAFNTTGYENLADADYGEQRLAMCYAGDDAPAKQTVTGLIDALGYEPCDTGGLFAARFLEPMALAWIHPARLGGEGSDFGFAIARRPAKTSQS